MFDLTIRLDVPRAELVRRLMARWLDLGMSRARAEEKVFANDALNVDLVLERSADADVTIAAG